MDGPLHHHAHAPGTGDLGPWETRRTGARLEDRRAGRGRTNSEESGSDAAEPRDVPPQSNRSRWRRRVSWCRTGVLGRTLSPQIVLRLGWGPANSPLEATPRLPVHQVIDRPCRAAGIARLAGRFWTVRHRAHTCLVDPTVQDEGISIRGPWSSASSIRIAASWRTRAYSRSAVSAQVVAVSVSTSG